MLVRRSPDWAAWSTVALCCVVGLVVSTVPGSAWAISLPDEGIGAALNWARHNSYIAITLSNVGIGSLWFLGACLFGRDRALSPQRQAEVAAFFTALRTDIPAAETLSVDHRRHIGIARMCFIYVGFITVLALFATDQAGRLGLLFCAAFLGTVGLAIRRAAEAPPTLVATD
ncbi:MAG: hypothetical protein J6386_03780 [Candidatus Synoicihabitans palmerolidicus]|nr:hypothetical protein [Candidatus Synoicihabitans palmerolidicus]